MASIRWLSALMVVAVVVAGCSLIVKNEFEQEVQPCDSAGNCSPGYVCVLDSGGDGGVCKSNDGGTVILDDGGMMLPDASTCTPRETACGDGRDNDCDNTTDCADTDCANVGCSDGDACTTGEVCTGGVCPRGTAVLCNSPNPCQQPNGTCAPSTGQCVYAPLPDGMTCGAGAMRCCSGACVNITLTNPHCGGCGLSCSAQQVCQPIESSGCVPAEPANTSGRCTCSGDAGCPGGQTCTRGVCFPAFASQCSPTSGQSIAGGVASADGGTCGYYCRY